MSKVKNYLVLHYREAGKEPESHFVNDAFPSYVEPGDLDLLKHTLWHWLEKAHIEEYKIEVWELGECLLDWS